MSDSGEPDENERLSDLDEIAESLRAGELDTATQFAERRAERTNDAAERSGGRTPSEILEDVRGDTDSNADRSGRELVKVELEVQVPRDESGSLSDRVENVLTRAFAPEIPSDSIHVRDIRGVTPTPNDFRIQVEVAIEAETIVENFLSRNGPKGHRGATVKLLS